MIDTMREAGFVWCLDCVWMQCGCKMVDKYSFWSKCPEFEPKDGVGHE